MTTIIGVQEAGCCWMAADSQTTDRDRAFISHRQNKIVERGEYLIGVAGDGAACDIAQFMWRPPAPIQPDLYLHMVSTAIPSLKKALVSNGYATSKDEDATLEMLIAVDGQLFHIASDFTVLMRNDGIYGIGSGSSYAIGALAAGASLEEAIDIAADNDMYTGLPCQVIRQGVTQ